MSETLRRPWLLEYFLSSLLGTVPTMTATNSTRVALIYAIDEKEKDVGFMVKLSDGTHSVRARVQRECAKRLCHDYPLSSLAMLNKHLLLLKIYRVQYDVQQQQPQQPSVRLVQDLFGTDHPEPILVIEEASLLGGDAITPVTLPIPIKEVGQMRTLLNEIPPHILLRQLNQSPIRNDEQIDIEALAARAMTVKTLEDDSSTVSHDEDKAAAATSGNFSSPTRHPHHKHQSTVDERDTPVLPKGDNPVSSARKISPSLARSPLKATRNNVMTTTTTANPRIAMLTQYMDESPSGSDDGDGDDDDDTLITIVNSITNKTPTKQPSPATLSSSQQQLPSNCYRAIFRFGSTGIALDGSLYVQSVAGAGTHQGVQVGDLVIEVNGKTSYQDICRDVRDGGPRPLNMVLRRKVMMAPIVPSSPSPSLVGCQFRYLFGGMEYQMIVESEHEGKCIVCNVDDANMRKTLPTTVVRDHVNKSSNRKRSPANKPNQASVGERIKRCRFKVFPPVLFDHERVDGEVCGAIPEAGSLFERKSHLAAE